MPVFLSHLKKREVTCEKMGITSGQRTLCLDLLQKLIICYAHTRKITLNSTLNFRALPLEKS